MSITCRMFIVVLLGCQCLAGDDVLASFLTIGPDGINSAGLSLPTGTALTGGNALTGSGIAIGQVEDFRPGLPAFDGVANSNSTVVPAAVFLQGGPAVAGANINNHYVQADTPRGGT